MVVIQDGWQHDSISKMTTQFRNQINQSFKDKSLKFK